MNRRTTYVTDFGRFCSIAALCIGTAIVTLAGARAQASEGGNGLDGRYYVSAMYSRIWADSARLTEDGNGAMLAFGKQFSEKLNFEFYLLGAKYNTESVSGSADLKAFAGAVHFFPFARDGDAPVSWLDGAYAVAGVGFGDGDSDAETVPSSYQYRYFYEAGLGYLLPLFGDLRLRIDGRYRFDQPKQGYDGTRDGDRGGFGERLVSIGLLMPIGRVAEPPPPTPVQVVSPVPPPPADADGDGVADSADQCPNSDAGIAVDAGGCAVGDTGSTSATSPVRSE